MSDEKQPVYPDLSSYGLTATGTDDVMPTKSDPERQQQQQVNPQHFRLQQICEIKNFFEDEAENRRKIYSKYKKAFL